jgi:hypothetical protein
VWPTPPERSCAALPNDASIQGRARRRDRLRGQSVQSRELIAVRAHGRLAPILKRRAALSPYAFVFGSPDGEFQDSFKTAWESLLLVANGHETKRARPGVRVDRAKLKRIDLH